MRTETKLTLRIHLMISAVLARLIDVVLHPETAELALGKLQYGASA